MITNSMEPTIPAPHGSGEDARSRTPIGLGSVLDGVAPAWSRTARRPARISSASQAGSGTAPPMPCAPIHARAPFSTTIATASWSSPETSAPCPATRTASARGVRPGILELVPHLAARELRHVVEHRWQRTAQHREPDGERRCRQPRGRSVPQLAPATATPAPRRASASAGRCASLAGPPADHVLGGVALERDDALEGLDRGLRRLSARRGWP